MATTDGAGGSSPDVMTGPASGPGSVIWGDELHNLSAPQLPHLYNGEE